MEGEQRIEIYRGLEGEVIFDVDAEEETIWATQAQMAQIFGVTRRNILLHLDNIYATVELDKKRTWKKNFQVRMEGKRRVRRELDFYNLDAIISVGYRVNSKKATNFRIWATGVLKKYVTDGVAVNEKRLAELSARQNLKKLENIEKIMGLVRRLTTANMLSAGEANGIIEVIAKYAGSFEALKEYDEGHIDLSFMGRGRKGRKMTVEMCDAAVERLRESAGGNELFGMKRSGEFDREVEKIFGESREGNESVPEKATNLLYYIVKKKPYYDGNKRIGALLFILFLTMNDYHLTQSGETKISDKALTAITLLIAESEAKEAGLIKNLVCKLLG